MYVSRPTKGPFRSDPTDTGRLALRIARQAAAAEERLEDHALHEYSGEAEQSDQRCRLYRNADTGGTTAIPNNFITTLAYTSRGWPRWTLNGFSVDQCDRNAFS